MTDLTQITPGLAGVSLGKNPNGAVSQIAAAYGGVSRSRVALGIACGVPTVLWVMARSGSIGNWTFTATLLVFLFGELALVPTLLAPIPGGRALPAGLWMCFVLILTGSFDWATVITSNGMKFVAMGLIAAVAGWVTSRRARRRASGAGTRPPGPSPDLLGVDRPITRSDVLDAELALGLDEEAFDGAA